MKQKESIHRKFTNALSGGLRLPFLNKLLTATLTLGFRSHGFKLRGIFLQFLLLMLNPLLLFLAHLDEPLSFGLLSRHQHLLLLRIAHSRLLPFLLILLESAFPLAGEAIQQAKQPLPDTLQPYPLFFLLAFFER